MHQTTYSSRSIRTIVRGLVLLLVLIAFGAAIAVDLRLAYYLIAIVGLITLVEIGGVKGLYYFFLLYFAIVGIFTREGYILIGPAKLYVEDILLVMLLILTFIKGTAAKGNQEAKIGTIPFETPIYILLTIAAFSLLRGLPLYGYQAIGEFRMLAFIPLYFITKRLLKAEKDYRWLVWTLVLSAVYISIMGGLNTLSALQQEVDFHTSVFFHVLGVAQTSILLLAVVTILVFRDRWKHKMLTIPLLIGFSAITLIAQVRATYVGIAAAVITGLYLYRNHLPKVGMSLAILGLVVGAVLVNLLPGDVASSLGSAVTSPLSYQSDVNGQWRLERAAIEMSRLWQNKVDLLFGRPFGAWFEPVTLFSQTFESITTHNAFLDLMTKVGVLGLLVVVWFIISFYRYIIPYAMRELPGGRNESRILKAAVICMSALLASLLAYGGFYDYLPGMLIGVIAGLAANVAGQIGQQSIREH